MAGFDSSYSERISRVVELLQGKWTVQILCAMRTGPVRLSELKREIPFASKKRAHVEFAFPRSRWSNLGTRPEQFGTPRGIRARTSDARAPVGTLRSFGMGNLECGYDTNISAAQGGERHMMIERELSCQTAAGRKPHPHKELT